MAHPTTNNHHAFHEDAKPVDLAGGGQGMNMGLKSKDQLRREVVLSPQTNYRGIQRKTSQSRRGSGPPTALSMGMPVLPDHSSSIGRRASPKISVARIAYVASPIRSHPSV